MIKQKARGYIFFENKTREEVEEVFSEFRFDQAKFKMFNEIEINNVKQKFPGVFLFGDINEKYTSENVVRLFRKLIKLKPDKLNFDLSVERENEIEEIPKDRDFKFYYGFDFVKSRLPEIIKRFEDELEGVKVFQRDIGYKDGEIISCLEVFSRDSLDQKIGGVMDSQNLEPINIKKIIF